jgi:chorismate dehydratase
MSVLASTAPVRVGVVSFLNTLPLIDGLDQLADFELRHSVPSNLIEQLLADEIEVGLCSSIDYQRSSHPLIVLPAGLLGCSGPTLTVRLYSTQPIERIAHVHCDTDSHTSVALMRIVLKERYGLKPAIVEYDAREHVAENRPIEWPDAMLLIGDKVVTDSPPAVRYPHQLDLGGAWLELTGRPFVFALWMAKREMEPSRLATVHHVLDRQRRYNRERVDGLVHSRAEPRGWPPDLADDYLKGKLLYAWTPAMREALELFFNMAHEHGLIDEPRTLAVLGEGD